MKKTVLCFGDEEWLNSWILCGIDNRISITIVDTNQGLAWSKERLASGIGDCREGASVGGNSNMASSGISMHAIYCPHAQQYVWCDVLESFS